jgi:DNA-binding transcriptional MerR regulator
MFSIGEFARHGRVSVRMLRHYDAIGLIRPACVDAATGYRLYQASQLDELNRVIALKDLGFTLQQVQAILEEKVSAAELRGMLRLRRAEIQASIEAETTQLAGVAASYEPEAITPVIQPLYHDVWCRLASADIPAAGPAVAYYEDEAQGGIVVHAAVPVAAASAEGVTIADLPEVDSAAAIIHHGSMDDVLPTGQALARWIDANGYRSAGYAREVTLHWCPDPEQWVTELQQPIDTTGG